MKNIYGFYKRIVKRDTKAIDEIESLEQAKEIIKMLVGSTQGIKVDNGLYPMDFNETVEVVAENSHRENGNKYRKNINNTGNCVYHPDIKCVCCNPECAHNCSIDDELEEEFEKQLKYIL